MARHISGPLHLARAGQGGAPLLLVHGNPFEHTSWMYQMAHLEGRFRVMAVDLPGYGRSPAAGPGLTMADVAQACWEALSGAEREPAVLVGLSVGATVVNEMARIRPQQTRALVLASRGYYRENAFVARRIADFRRLGLSYIEPYALSLMGPDFQKTQPARDLARLCAERNERADVDTICRMFEALGQSRQEELIEAIACPTLVLSGDQDPAHQAAFALAERIAGSEMAVIEGGGHACNMDHPLAFDEHLLSFLARAGIA